MVLIMVPKGGFTGCYRLYFLWMFIVSLFAVMLFKCYNVMKCIILQHRL